ncbi:MAG: tetratricopeptide repeat protein [Deltaproteobacteria bacterium]|nr:tetratricopeptide repeat protein [Deltaproteobacteria bacterium]
MNENELEKLSQAVRKNPGSADYPRLAWALLDGGRLEQARACCESGFAANPRLEAGTLAYFSVLDRLADTEGAHRLFLRLSRRTAALDLAYAQLLVNAGQAERAREILLQTVERDPDAHDARRGLERLAQPDFGDDGDTLLSESDPRENTQPLSGTDLVSHDAPPPLPLAAVQPRPIGQRTSATSLFDLTTPPPLLARAMESPFESVSFRGPEKVEQAGHSDSRRAASDAFGEDLEESPTNTAWPPPQSTPLPSVSLTPTDIGHTDRRADPPSARPMARIKPLSPRRSTLPIALLAALLLGGAGFGAWWLHSKRSQSETNTQPKPSRLSDDTLAGYRDALQQAGTSAELKALASAHLWLRFGQSSEGDVKRRVGALKPNHPLQSLFRAFFAIAEERYSEGLALSQTAVPPRWAWHGQLLALIAAERAGDRKQVMALVGHVERDRNATAALLYRAGRYLRLIGDEQRATPLIERGRRLSPGHLGLLFEQLALRQRSRTLPKAPLAAARQVPRLAAAAMILRARHAQQIRRPSVAQRLLDGAAKLDPANLEPHLLRARWALTRGGDVFAAVADAQRVTAKLTSLRPDFKLTLAELLVAAGQPGAARSALEQYQPQGSDEQRHADRLAIRVAAALGDLRRVERRCDRSNERDRDLLLTCILSGPDAAWASRILTQLGPGPVKQIASAAIALSKGEPRQAIAVLRELRGREQLALRRLLHGQALLLANDTKGAIKMLRQARQLDGHSVRTTLALAEALVSAGQLGRARPLVDLLGPPREQPPLAARLAPLLIKLDQTTRAKALLADLDLESPSGLRAAIAIHQALGDNATAGKLSARLAKQAPTATVSASAANQPPPPSPPEDTPTPPAAETKLTLAQLTAKAGRAPRDPDLQLKLAEALFAANRAKSAYQHGAQALLLARQQRRKDLAELTLRLARQLVELRPRWAHSAAKRQLEPLLSAARPPAEALYLRGRLAWPRYKTQALRFFRRAIAANPKFAPAHRELARVLIAKRRQPAALRALNDYAKLDPQGATSDEVKAWRKALATHQ